MLKFVRIAVFGAALIASGLVGATAAQAAPAAGTSGGASGLVATPTATPRSQLVPAFDHALPTSGSFGPGAATSTAATPSAALASWVCTVYASDPWKSGSEIEGDGWQSCSGTGYAPARIKVTIQRYVGLGIWNNRYQYPGDWTSADFDQATIWYDCSGDGTRTYRIVTDGYAQSGAYHQAVQSLNYLRVSC
jgi:hypothetical protein